MVRDKLTGIIIMAYKWKKTAWKGAKVFVVGGLTALGAWLAAFPPETMAGAAVVAVAAVNMGLNWLKHHDEE